MLYLEKLYSIDIGLWKLWSNHRVINSWPFVFSIDEKIIVNYSKWLEIKVERN